MEILGVLSAVMGVVAAIINRKRIVVLRYERYDYSSSSSTTGPQPVTVGKRFKRCVLALLGAFLLPALEVMTAAQLKDVLIWPFGILLLIAAYQFMAMLILMVARLWR